MFTAPREMSMHSKYTRLAEVRTLGWLCMPDDDDHDATLAALYWIVLYCIVLSPTAAAAAAALADAAKKKEGSKLSTPRKLPSTVLYLLQGSTVG